MFLKKSFFTLTALSFSLYGFANFHFENKTADKHVFVEKCCQKTHKKKCKQSTPKICRKKPKKPKNHCVPESIQAGCPLKKDQVPSGYNYPARPSIEGKCNFMASVSFIYWQMLEDQLSFIWDFKLDKASLKKINWNYKYAPGFQVEFGVYFGNHDDWKLDAEYIRYHAHNHMKRSIRNNVQNEAFVIPFWAGGRGGFAHQAEGHMKLGYDALHLMMSRPYYLGNHLICDLGFGLRAWGLRNKLDTSFFSSPDDEGNSFENDSHHSCKAWALGPRAMFDTQFLLGKGWKFVGKGAASLLYRNNKAKSQLVPFRHIDFPGTLISTDHSNLLSPELELGLGLAWGSYMNCQKQHIEFTARYDWQVFWNHKMILDYENSITTTDAPSSNLFLGGLTITAAFDF